MYLTIFCALVKTNFQNLRTHSVWKREIKFDSQFLFFFFCRRKSSEREKKPWNSLAFVFTEEKTHRKYKAKNVPYIYQKLSFKIYSRDGYYMIRWIFVYRDTRFTLSVINKHLLLYRRKKEERKEREKRREKKKILALQQQIMYSSLFSPSYLVFNYLIIYQAEHKIITFLVI